MRESKRKILEEYKKYSHIQLDPESVYFNPDTTTRYKLVEVDENANVVTMEILDTGRRSTKTIHWCKKNLLKE
jgi:exopolysaccharide biosynthesis predicted pyruvyltransferase EpsI